MSYLSFFASVVLTYLKVIPHFANQNSFFIQSPICMFFFGTSSWSNYRKYKKLLQAAYLFIYLFSFCAGGCSKSCNCIPSPPGVHLDGNSKAGDLIMNSELMAQTSPSSPHSEPETSSTVSTVY